MAEIGFSGEYPAVGFYGLGMPKSPLVMIQEGCVVLHASGETFTTQAELDEFIEQLKAAGLKAFVNAEWRNASETTERKAGFDLSIGE